ncbi:MAG: glutamate-5-semialdehyde dehydrogenase [Acidimicrobiales bacterium]
MEDYGSRAKSASRVIARTGSTVKNGVLNRAAALIEEREIALLSANEIDLERGEQSGLDPAQLDRLKLDGPRVRSMAAGLRQVATLPDPIGEVTDGWLLANGLQVERVRAPLGVIGIVYENRPNVTADAAGLCLKSGNAVILRGSSSAMESNKAIVAVIREALMDEGLPEDCAILLEDASHEAAVEFMRMNGYVDCLIPRGGKSLLSTVVENATVPVIIDGDGNCHIYIDSHADIDMALDILANAKLQRPGVCNAAESLVVHRDIAAEFLPLAVKALPGVDLVGDAGAREIAPSMGAATSEDFATEYLGLKMSVAVVDNLDDAISHINTYGSGHSEAIVTESVSASERFLHEVDAAAVLVNASTRLVDGGELGLGAEIGISTQKLHARGPMGLKELTCTKWILRGNGQVRK